MDVRMDGPVETTVVVVAMSFNWSWAIRCLRMEFTSVALSQKPTPGYSGGCTPTRHVNDGFYLHHRGRT